MPIFLPQRFRSLVAKLGSAFASGATAIAGASGASGLAGCQTRPSQTVNRTQAAPAPGAVPEEASLKADRSALDKLRGEVSPEVKRENDELALALSIMKDGTEEPSKVRDRFNKALRDKRERMDKRLRKDREAFGKTEKKARDEFVKKLAKDRDRFMARKNDRERTKEFFDEQEAKRKEYFDAERDRRNVYESEATETRKTFEDYARERTNWFNQEMRGYSTAWYERQKALGQKKSSEDKRRRSSAPAVEATLDGEAQPLRAGEPSP